MAGSLALLVTSKGNPVLIRLHDELHETDEIGQGMRVRMLRLVANHLTLAPSCAEDVP